MAIVKKEDIIRITAERLDYANNSFSITAETLVSIDDPDDDQLPIKELKMIQFQELDRNNNAVDLSLLNPLVAKVANAIFSSNTTLS
jgi:hypothetical protein